MFNPLLEPKVTCNCCGSTGNRTRWEGSQKIMDCKDCDNKLYLPEDFTPRIPGSKLSIVNNGLTTETE